MEYLSREYLSREQTNQVRITMTVTHDLFADWVVHKFHKDG